MAARGAGAGRPDRGASTPNNVVGEVVDKILALRGLQSDALVAVVD
jgi:hypothetical protein